MIHIILMFSLLYIILDQSQADRILVTGCLNHKQLGFLLPIASISLVTSKATEAFGMVSVEAMSAGTNAVLFILYKMFYCIIKRLGSILYVNLKQSVGVYFDNMALYFQYRMNKNALLQNVFFWHYFAHWECSSNIILLMGTILSGQNRITTFSIIF